MTSESVKSKTSFAHCAIPGEYSAHSTCTLEMVSPSAPSLRTFCIPLAITSRWSAVRLGLTYSARTFWLAPWPRQYASAFASLGVVASKVRDPVSVCTPRASSVASSSVIRTFSASSISATTVAVAPTSSTMSSVEAMSEVARTWWSRTTTSFARSSQLAQSARRSRRCASTTPTHRISSGRTARFSLIGNLFLCRAR